jgi:hypothetical protein
MYVLFQVKVWEHQAQTQYGYDSADGTYSLVEDTPEVKNIIFIPKAIAEVY